MPQFFLSCYDRNNELLTETYEDPIWLDSFRVALKYKRVKSFKWLLDNIYYHFSDENFKSLISLIEEYFGGDDMQNYDNYMKFTEIFVKSKTFRSIVSNFPTVI